MITELEARVHQQELDQEIDSIARERSVVVSDERPHRLHVARFILPVTAVLGVIAVACAPTAAEEQPGSQVNPTGGKPAIVGTGRVPSIETPQVVISPTPRPPRQEVSPSGTSGGPGGEPKPEVNPLQQFAKRIGVPSKENTGGLVRFERIVTEPKGEVLFFSPDSLIGQYASLDLRSAVPERNIDTLRSVRDGLINRAINASVALEAGKKDEAFQELESLKKRIEVQSRGDKATGMNIDNNENGISDYLESFYGGVVATSNQISPSGKG